MTKKQFFSKNGIKRFFMSVVGVLICGLSVGLFKHAALGVDPFQALMSGLDAWIPLDFGTLYVVVNAVLLVFSLILERHKIGLATLLNLFLLGYVVEFSQRLFASVLPETGLLGRVILLLIGLVIMCLSAAFYFTADLGVSTYDAVALVLSERCRRIPFRYLRILTDFICVVLGVSFLLLSGRSLREIAAAVGAGTVITAFFMGPLIDFFKTHIAEPFLER